VVGTATGAGASAGSGTAGGAAAGVGVSAGSGTAAGAVAPPETRCAVADPRLLELSGLVWHRGALWSTDDGGRRVELHRLDLDGPECAVADTRTADIDPFDVEDLALGPGGSIWVADTGDNQRRRETVAVVVLPERGAPRLHRLTYPDGPHDAEALLVDDAGVPHVITKEAGRPAGVYRTEVPPEGTGPTPLVRVASVSLPASQTPGGPIGGLGSRTVTGAAATGDGRVVALRTYTDAWLFTVPDGDLTAALQGDPVQVPLPDEPQGEAIAFGADGTLYSGSELRGGVRGEIRAVPGAAALVAPQVPGPEAPAPAPVPDPAAGPVADPAPEWLPAAAGAGVLAGLLVLLGVAMSMRARR
jgi:hypothetical protein